MSSPTDTALNADNFNDSLNEVGETEEQNAQPPAKKRKLMKKKVTTAEKVMTSMMEAFLQSQRESEERFLKYEERRTNEEGAHKQRILQMLLCAPSTSRAPPYFPLHPSVFYYQTDYQPHNMQLNDDYN